MSFGPLNAKPLGLTLSKPYYGRVMGPTMSLRFVERYNGSGWDRILQQAWAGVDHSTDEPSHVVEWRDVPLETENRERDGQR